ncbi:MAG: hypothetical protein HYT90_03165 [Candidatus Omnitrophica bacterium]|nr:hypothetical protein [Candidatus Omnitrophota bacterium]
MTMTRVAGWVRRMRWSSSSPSIPGSFRSTSTTGGSWASTNARPDGPVSATWTS